jgi:hypothetical protein
MPFPDQNLRPFTQADIERITPNQFGCYGLVANGSVVYVGKGDIRTRLLAHLNGDNAVISICEPTHWVSVVTSNMDEREKQLILEYFPICNQRVG